MPRDAASAPPSPSAVRRLLGGLLSLARTRLELIGIDVAEEKDRLLLTLFIGLGSMLFGLMALLTLTALIAAAFWDSYRWQALAGLTLLYLLGALFCGWKAWSRVRHAPPIFATTVAELEKDIDAFRAAGDDASGAHS
jgi:uncharacterized membrane protein YqjE